MRTGADAHVLLLCMHHIVSDGWSMGVLVREVAALYEALSQGRESPLPELAVQYADYAAWQRRVLEGPALTPQLDWWRSRLEGAPTLELPTDHSRPAVRTLRGATHAFTMPPSLVAGLERVGQEQGATLFMVLMAGWQALLARYSGQTDFCVGTPVAHRTRPELEGLIGFFVNTLALRANVEGDPRFDDLVARVREESLAAFSNQDVPFDRLVEALGGQRDLSRTPLFQAAFVLQNAPMQPPTLPGMAVDVLRTGTDTARFDVTLLLVERGGRLEGELEYSMDLFTPDTARRMVDHLQRLLRGVTEDAARRISAVPLWSEAERHEVLVAWNDTAAPYPADTTVHQRFMAQARRTPERVAVTFEGRSLTYSELDARSNQLARHLVSLGLEPEFRIGVCASRGLELVIGVLGALKAGGCYVPLDPSWPVKRLEHASSTARLSAVLTWQSLLPSLKDGPWRVVALDADAADIARQSTEAVQVPAFPEGLAFATFTSGSTGTPKGVALPHRGLLRLSEASRFLTQAPEEVTLQLSPLAFDVSSVELWGTLLHGGKLVVYPPGTPEPDAVARLIVEHKVSSLILATSLFELLQQHQPEVLARVPHLMVGGEAMPAPRARERLAQGGALTNAYGPTECSTVATRLTLSPGDAVGRSVPIGRPIDNTEVYVLDPALRPVPVGVPGELCLGGPGLARGYLNRPDLTAERFVPHPFSAAPGARLYRTGDRVRWRSDGVLEFLGRLDHQVKVRGFRIELGEIEAVLRGHPSVSEATAVVREDASGSSRLVAYVVPSLLEVASLREYLHQHLPDYMVPSAFVGLDAFPLTPTGKVDRQALPAPDLSLGAADFVEPRTELEQQLAALFREALGLERVGLNDDFFLLGGHSLLATQVVTRLRAQLGVELPLRTFFEAPTVARLAARLESAPRTRALLPLESLPRPAQGEATFDVSFAQRRLWFMEQLQPGLAVNHMPAALRLTGRLDVEALRRTFAEVVRRHEAVRTTFVTREGQPAQRIHLAPAEWPLPVEDLSGLAPEARDAAVQARMAEEAHRAFDLEKGPLLRTVLLRTGADAHVLLLCMHHIVSDGWSMGVLVREVAALYEALSQGRESPLPELAVQYADYAAWQRRVLEGSALTPQLDWWRSRLEGAPTLELPTDHARPAVRGAQGASYFFSLSAEQVVGLERVASAHNATLFLVLMAGWQALLARYSGQTDFTVGTSVAARNRPELEGLIGFFVNPLALRCQLDGNPTFGELVARVREEALGAFAHQEVPFEQLVDAVGGERDLSRTPLFQTLFVLLNADLLQAPSLPGLHVDLLPTATDTSRFDLTLSLMAQGGALKGQLEYSLELFTPETARRMVAHLRVLLAAVVDGAGAQRLRALPLMDARERQQVLSDWNATQAAYPVDATVPSLFAAQALRTPLAIAVEHDGRTLTYAELDARSNQLAHHLRSLGLGAEARVGVFLHRGLDLLVGLLGILKAGGAYVPLDPEYPAQRLTFMAEDSGVAAILTESALEEELPAGSQLIVILDDEGARIERQPSTPVTGGLVGPDQLAYITYTSGSTGTPKGVAIPHRGVVRLLIGSHFVDLGPSEVVLQLAPLAFDASTLEIWGALLHGARLVLHPQRTPDLAELGQALRRHQVSVLWLTAALFDQMQQHQPEALGKVRQLLAGGDVLPALRVRERLAQGVGLVNGYGPTEGTTFTACHRMSPGDAVGDSVSIGRPIANTQVYVLDPDMRAVPVGVPGEVFIGGDGLARGYLGQPALTAERFVPHPFGPPGARLYRSGDRARWQVDGTLQFLGRVDFQVKLRGFRIELGELEAALRTHAAVETATALVREDLPGDRRLVAYVTPEDVDTAALREHLRQRLPEYMVPNAVVALSTLPLSPNGKVDRKALPAPDLSPAEDPQAAGLPLLQQQLATLFREVLRVERVRPQDDFFELGGHSLLATQLVTRIRAALGVEVPLRTMFEAPTLAGLAERVEALMMQASRAAMPPLLPVPRDAALPLSFAQQRLWFLSQLQKGQAVYNVPFALKLSGALDVDVLRRTFAEVVQRHEVLRTAFTATEGLPTQQVQPAPEVWDLPVEDLSALKGPARDARVRHRMTEEAHFPFNLAVGPLLRTVLLRLDAEEHVLLLCLHHIASDGWSLGVLVREVAALYAAFREGQPSPLPPLAVQYADFAAWQRQWVQSQGIQTQLDELRSHLKGVPALALNGDLGRPATHTVRGASQFFTVSPELVEALEKVARDQGATLFMVLLAAYEVLLSRYSGQKDFCVGSPIAHRTQAELEPLVGFFVNTLALRARLDGAPTFAELVSRVREESLAAYVRQDVPFDRLVEAVGGERGGGRSPLIQVMFALQNAPMQPPSLPDVTVEPLRSTTETARLDLTLSMMDQGDGGLEGALEFSLDLFTPEAAQRLTRHFHTLLEAVVREPQTRIHALPLLPEDEQQQVLKGFQGRELAPASEATIHALMEAQVARTPDAEAVAFETERLTYRELEARANQVAHHLRAMGVAPESLVGVCLERSVDLVVALLGVLKAGAAYVPVDPAYPKERLGWMLEDTGASVLLTHEKWKSVLPPSAARVVCLDSEAGDVSKQPVTKPLVQVGPESLAYVIFTSGSTGRPKGAMNAHGGVVNRLKWMQEEYGLGGTDVVLQKTPFSFDVSVWEFFWPLLAGAKLVVARPGGHQEPAYLVKLMKAEGVTTVHFVPSMLRAFVEEPGLEGLGSLRRVVCSGEALSAELVKKAYARLPAPVRVHNLYGPTEAAVDVTYWPCPRGEDFHRVPIGRPVANTVLYVLDTHGQPTPVGIPGELHIGGVQVGRGYWQRPQLTAERFIPDAFSGTPGARLYRTGDVARWLPDGTLEYLGRADFQVKLRGFRIELGEVETALAADPAVRDSVVLAREDSTGDQRLVAYVVLDDAAAAQEVDASSQWQAIYDEAYARETPESEDPTFNIVGWEDSYTGDPLPPAQMREWVDTTVAQVLGFQPKRVLELGCGTGLLLYRLAPRCEAYWGVDFARPALDRIERQRERMGGALDSVHLLHRSVDDFSGLEPGSFDTVVINSVIQYFSSPEFLLDVLRGAVRVLKPGGRVFLGDVRSLELLEAFRASVRLHRTAGPVATSQFAYRVQRDLLAEKELVLSPAFFTALPERIPGIQRVDVLPKHGRYDNELSRFRYEVVLHVGDAAESPARRTKPDWVDGAGLTLDGLREQLRARPGLLAVRGLPNARVLEPTRLVELLAATPPPTVAGLREALRDWPGTRGVEPEDLYALGAELGFEVRVSWASAHRDGALDVVFARPGEADTVDLSPEPKQAASWERLASDPLRGARSARAVSRLRDALADKLPAHMVPSAFVVLPTLPLSPNGKVDRKALPAPEAERLGAADAFIAPRTPTEEQVARIFGEILGQSRVGANDDFFALGGHSLLATQVVVRVRAQLNTEISLRTLFDAPTVARLAERIEAQSQLAEAPGVPALVPLERGPSADEGLAVSFAQQRLWFLEQLQPGQVAYNLPAALRLTGRLDVEDSRFEAAPAAAVGVLLESGRAPSPRAASSKPELLSNTDGAERAHHDSEAATGAGAQQEGPRQSGVTVEAHIRASTFTGPYRRAVRLRGADVRATLEDLQFTGVATAVGVDGAYAEVRRSTAEGGQAAAFSVMDGTLILEEVSVTGHEYGVSSMRARRLDVHRFTSVRAIRAGMGLLMSQARLRDIVVRDSGAYGGLQFSGGDLDVQGVRVDGAAEYGVVALRGKLRLRDVDIRRVHTADGVTGDGLHLRQVEADVEGVVVRDAQGACVLAAQNARVSLRDAKLEKCGYVGLLTDTLARMNAANVEIQGAATALGALGNGELRVESLSATGLESGFIHAECEGTTQVHLKEFRSEDARGLSARCVHASPK
nr:non-ribosomal peptide synthetase [Myxococcus vastator]